MLFSNRMLLVVAASVAVLPCDGQPPGLDEDGRVVLAFRVPPDNREVLSAPILGEPIYECTEGVWVSGFIPGAQIDIWGAGIPTPVGTDTSQFASGDKFKVSVTFKEGMVVTATTPSYKFVYTF
jgi:hypothetical protein